jgi:hypothetical protein
MKIAESTIQVQSAGIQSEAFFTVKEKNVGHIFSILRNKLYSNKPLAIIREYCTNAFDAHVEAGISDKPIQVSFPTAFKNSLTIRDFGFGLSEDDVYNVFASYGESTKRGTNDQVGMMGLGSKSAFCYVNDFTITSYHNGTKSVYLAYIDETNVGKVSKIAEEPTTESGLAIDVVVKTIDLQSFREVAGKFLCEFNPKPIVLNDDSVVQAFKANKNDNVILQSEHYEITRKWYANSSFVRMGNVSYPFQLNDLQLNTEDTNKLDCFRYLQVKLYAPIGSVVPSASRESLEMDDQSKQYIVGALYRIIDDVRTDVQSQLDECKSLYQFILKCIDLSDVNSTFGIVPTFQGVKFRGYNSFSIKKSDMPTCSGIKELQDTIRKTFTNSQILMPTAGQTIYTYHGNVPQNSIRKRIIDTGARLNKSYLLEFKNEADKDALVNDPKFIGAKFVDVSTLPYTRVKGTSVGAFAKSEVYLYAPNRNLLRDTWIPENVSLNEIEGVYIELKRFLPVGKYPNGNTICSMEGFKTLLDYVSNCGIRVPKLYGIKYSDVDKLGSGWVELTAYIQQQMDALTAEQIERINTYMVSTYVSHEWANAFRLGMSDTDKDITRLKEIIEGHHRSNSFNNSQGYKIEHLVSHGFKINLDVYKECNELIDKTLSKYPILRNLFGYDDKYRIYDGKDVNPYWTNINNYLKSQDYLQSEGLLD